VSVGGLSRALIRLAPLYAAAGVVFVTLAFISCVHSGLFGYDFHGTIWEAGKNILHGRTPYPAPDPDALVRKGNPAVYPAPTLVAATPFALLPMTLSAALWDVLSLGALLAALRIVGVRDWRVYAVVLLSCPAFLSFKLGQIDSLEALGCALAWRWRRAPGPRLALCVGVTFALKLLLWPLLVWLVAIGRRRAAAGALAVALVEAVAGWSVLGLSSLRAYPHLIVAATTAFGDKGYSLMALGTRLGIASSPARLLPVAGALALCAVCVWASRRGRLDDALVAAVAAGVLGSPVLGLQYALILLVWLAITRPRLSPAWSVALLFWFAPAPDATSARMFVVGFACLVTLIVVGFWRPAVQARGVRNPVAA